MVAASAHLLAGPVGAVVVHYGDPAPTVGCLAALRGDAAERRRRVVVVDNSGDFPAEALQGEELLRCPDNPGFGGGANRGVAALGEGPWSALVVLNHDVEVAPGYLEAAVAALAEPAAGAAGGPLFLDRPGGRLWFAGGGVNFLIGTVRQSTSERAARTQRRVGFIPGAALAFSQRAWREVGGFDPAYFLYNEDVDICLRLRRRGWALVFAPGMAAVHRLGAATGSGARSRLYLEEMTATRLRPFRPLGYRIYLGVLHSGYVAVRALWHAVGRGGRDGRTAAGALLRGHARAIARIGSGPAR